MRTCFIVAISLTILASLHCTDIADSAARARVNVYVHWGDMPLSQKKVEVVQTGEVKETNEKGLAEFELAAGSYTIRVFNINRGGPSFQYVDFNVEIKSAETKVVDVVDCLPCV